MVDGHLRSIGQLTYFGAHQPTLDRGFGTIPYLQLAEDAAHVVGHGLATHEQPGRDLRIRQPLHEQPEHVLLSRCEDPDASAAGPRRDAESPQERRDPISVESCAELLVRRLGATSVLDSEVRPLAGGDHRERNVDFRPLVREPQVGPCGQRAFQNSDCRTAIIGRARHQPTRSQRSGHSPRLSGRLG